MIPYIHISTWEATLERANVAINKIIKQEGYDVDNLKILLDMRGEEHPPTKKDASDNSKIWIIITCIWPDNQNENDCYKRTYIKYKKRGSVEYSEMDF